MHITKNIISNAQAELAYKLPTLGYVGYIRKAASAPHWSSPVHRHDYTEVMLCAKGEGTLMIEGSEYAVKEGDIIVYPKFTVHQEISFVEKPMEFFFMGVDSFCYPPLPPDTLLDGKTGNTFSAGPYLAQLQFYMSELLRESSECGSLHQPMLSALSSLIVTTILRAMDYSHTREDKKKSYCSSIKMYIDSNYKQDINLSTLAETVYVSRHYISHIFKHNYGTSPIEYLINKRLSIAKQLLTSSSKSIGEIAQEVGYKDPLYFSQMFKQRMGVSPSAYRNSGAEK